jgi:hypothetical protein
VAGITLSWYPVVPYNRIMASITLPGIQVVAYKRIMDSITLPDIQWWNIICRMMAGITHSGI